MAKRQAAAKSAKPARPMKPNHFVARAEALAAAGKLAAILSVRQGDTAAESEERERKRAKIFASLANV